MVEDGGKEGRATSGVSWKGHIVAAFLECWVLALAMRYGPGMSRIESDSSLCDEKKRGNAPVRRTQEYHFHFCTKVAKV